MVVLLWNKHTLIGILRDIVEVILIDREITVVEGATTYSAIILHVCRTGKKEQYYTLYEEALVVNKIRTTHTVYYVQNLSHKLEVASEKAQNKAREYVDSKFWHTVEIEYHDSPRMVYNKMEAFGAEFTTSKSGTTMWARATPEFWEQWKTNKQEIKDAGFWVKKTDSYQWLIFCKVEAKFDNR